MIRLPIHEQLEQVKTIEAQAEDEFFANPHKRDREWWILGHVVALLAQTGHEHPNFAEPTEPPEPDFITYEDEDTTFKKIEIAEVLRFGRRRHEEIKKAFTSDTPVPKTIHPANDPFRSFRDVLISKFSKRYGLGCLLVMMHSMMIYEFPGPWACGWAAKLRDEYDVWRKGRSPVRLDESPYEKILVWNPSTDELVTIFPRWSIIHSPHNPL